MEESQLKISCLTMSPAPLAPNLLTSFSLTLQPGDVLGILGSNGVGKTTLLKCLSGCLVPQSGEIRLGHHAFFGPNQLNIKKQIGFLPDTVPLIPYFTVEENLNWMATFRGLDRHEAKKAITYTSERLGLKNWSPILAKHLSLGQRKLVGIAGTLIHQPKLTILDEPLNDLDTQVRERVLDILQTTAKHSIVIFTSHYYRDLASISNKILLLEDKQPRWVLDKTAELTPLPMNHISLSENKSKNTARNTKKPKIKKSLREKTS